MKTEHEVGKITITLEETEHGILASSVVKNTLHYKHSKMYQGYTQKQILSKFAREVRELEKASGL